MTPARRLIGAGLIIAVLILIGILGQTLFKRRVGSSGGVAADDAPGVGMQAVTLYFADPEGGDLATERRDLIVGANNPSLVAAALEALAAGPQARLARLVPIPPKSQREIGRDQGLFEVPDDFNAALPADLLKEFRS